MGGRPYAAVMSEVGNDDAPAPPTADAPVPPRALLAQPVCDLPETRSYRLKCPGVLHLGSAGNGLVLGATLWIVLHAFASGARR